MIGYPCPCCGYLTLGEEPGTGSYEICPVCFWEDDPIQFEDPTYSGGANIISLEESRINYLKFGACSKERLRNVRNPLNDEKPTNIQLEQVDSKSEILKRLETCEQILLGEEDEYTNEYFQVARPACFIGICSGGHGLKPSGFFDYRDDAAWIGYNSKITKVNLSSLCKEFTVELDHLFYTFLDQSYAGSIIAVYELGLIRIGSQGETIWNHSTDVITEFADEGNLISLQTDSGAHKIDKKTGLACD